MRSSQGKFSDISVLVLAMERLLLTLVIIFVSLAAGYFFQRRVVSVRSKVTESQSERLRLSLQKVALFGLIPFSAMLSLWGLPSPDGRLLALPVLGVFAWIMGGVLALLASRLMGLPRTQAGSMYCCGTFINIGAVGALVAVMQFGEESIAYSSLFRLCEELFYFSVACPVAHWFGSKEDALGRASFRIGPVLKLILLALGLGIALNLLGVRRPALFGWLSAAAMILGTIFFLFSIGMGLRLSRVACYVPQAAVLSFIKFVCVPMAVFFAAKLAGLGGVPLKVLVILSAMPVAMNALILPSLFRLDLDLANACWLISTAALVVVLPALMLILPLL